MSAHIAYDPTRLLVRRLLPNGTWTVIDAATISITSGYTPDDNGTLIIDAETATISLSFWDTPGPLLYPGDRIEARYAGENIFAGWIDTAQLAYSVDPEAVRHGAYRRVDFTATAAGMYATILGRTVTWVNLPKEKAIVRIRRWLTVDNF